MWEEDDVIFVVREGRKPFETNIVNIDAQQELIEGNQEDPVFQKEQLLGNINKVIDKAKSVNVPVIFVRDLDVAGGMV